MTLVEDAGCIRHIGFRGWRRATLGPRDCHSEAPGAGTGFDGKKGGSGHGVTMQGFAIRRRRASAARRICGKWLVAHRGRFLKDMA